MESRTGKRTKRRKENFTSCVVLQHQRRKWMDRSGLQKEKRPTVDEEQVTGKKKAVAKLYQKMQMPSTSSLLSAYASMTTSIMLFRTMFDQLVPPQVRRITKSEKEDQINVGLGEQVEMVDSFEGIPITWNYYSKQEKHKEDRESYTVERKYIELTFEKKYKDAIITSYLPSIVNISQEIKNQKKVVQLHTLKTRYPGEPPLKRTMKLNHPSTFDTLAMDPKQKKMIIDDLDLFVKRRDFYKKVGKAWKRGIKLPNRMTLNAMTKEPGHDDPKTRPALLRPGRMDVHIHMSYLTCDGFKTLAANYLNIHDYHWRFREIKELIECKKVTPAQVAEELMKSDNAEVVLEGLTKFLKRMKRVRDETNEVIEIDEDNEVPEAKRPKLVKTR
ncbi:hypothetical protein CTI12_AA570080 [Artemisia annua]|uniref:AAA+ ATPase At3g28540-like C-terminal domain-containing protein n=1 Tax=Artemisia annua TaxID=35608 RepID=A0A2U1KSF9_ARTAN|nr:hypothetical protein CTI12_AA570080 [Artemisia annua]